MTLKNGDQAPDFLLPDQAGKNHQLKDYSGKWLVVYFYPKDDTLGCTKEACNFRDSIGDYQKQGISIIGISKDSVESHQKFQSKYQLNFPILSDIDHKIIETYGVWGSKKFLGKEFLGTKRKTVIVDPNGKVRKIYDNVDPKIHAAEILKDISDLQMK
jgi:thioredoxin-dependent peroxiredoxin